MDMCDICSEILYLWHIQTPPVLLQPLALAGAFCAFCQLGSVPAPRFPQHLHWDFPSPPSARLLGKRDRGREPGGCWFVCQLYIRSFAAASEASNNNYYN